MKKRMCFSAIVSMAGLLFTGPAVAHDGEEKRRPDITPDKVEALIHNARHKVTARVAAGEEGELRGVRVRFDILSGPNAGKSFAGVTDHDGRLSWKYPAARGPAGLGTDRIQATFLSADGSMVYGRALATETWVDTTGPDADCDRVGSSHDLMPASTLEARGRRGDVFRLLAEDEVWPARKLKLYVKDTGSGKVFGPFPAGTTIRYVKNPRATPESRPGLDSPTWGSGSVDYHLVGRGTPVLTAVDGSGNVGRPDRCNLH